MFSTANFWRITYQTKAWNMVKLYSILKFLSIDYKKLILSGFIRSWVPRIKWNISEF